MTDAGTIPIVGNSSSVRKFSDGMQYAHAIRAAQCELTSLDCGQFASTLVRIDLPHLWIQRFSENLPRVIRVALWPARASISFSATPASRFMWGGRESIYGTVDRLGVEQEIVQRSLGPVEFGTMSLPADQFSAACEAITHHAIRLGPDATTVQPSVEAIANLQRLHAAAAALAESAPSVLAVPEASRSLEQKLILAMIQCCTAPGRDDSLALRHHQSIMRRFLTFIEANEGNPLYVPEICAALGVSSRTLQRCCQEQLGVGPLRYLWLRRMHLVRRALAASSPSPGRVTAIATRHGFWELGRFSIAYRMLFGESPSATLKHRS